MGPAREHLRHRRAWLQRLRDCGWRGALYVFLTFLAVANLYPFLWMTGTSLKSRSEAIEGKEHLLPGLKFSLADRPFLEPFAHGSDGRPVDTADREAVARAKIAAEQHIDELAAREAADEQLNEHQREILATLRYRDLTNKVINAVFVPYAVSYRTYTTTAGYRTVTGDGPEVYDYQRGLTDLQELASMGKLQAVYAEPANYAVVWSEMRFWMYTATSFLMTSAVVIIVVMMSAMLGYALARIRFPGKWLLLGLLIAGSVAPTEANLIAIFRLLLATGLLENMWGTILWLAGVSIGNALLMAGFFLTLPKEVEEAAYVDGAGPFRTFFTVAMPMAKPIVMTVGLFAFLGAWNNFIIPLITTISEPSRQPLAMAVYMFRTGYEQEWHWINAAATMMVIPVVILFILLQRYIVNAIAVGAVKG